MNLEQLKSLNRALAEAEAGFEARLRNFTEQLQQVHQALQQEQARAGTLQQEGESLHTQVRELQEALAATGKQARAEASAHQATAARLQAEIDGLYTRLTAVQADAAQREEQWRAQLALRTEEAQGAWTSAEAARHQHEAQLHLARQELQDARETLARRLAEVTAEARSRQKALEAQLDTLGQARQGLSAQLDTALADNARLRTLADAERTARQVEAARAAERAEALRQQCQRAEDALRAQAAEARAAQEEAAARANARLADLGAALARLESRLESRLADQDLAHARERESLQEMTATAQGQARSAVAEAERQRQALEASLRGEEARRTGDLLRHAEERRQLKAEHEQAQWRWDQRERQHAEALRGLQSALRLSEQRARSLALAVERLEGQLRAQPLPVVAPEPRQAPATQPPPDPPAEPRPAPPPPPVFFAEPAASQELPPACTTAETTSMDIEHVNQLLAFRGGEFVTQAYRAVLGREPDPQGLAHFQRRVETQHDKAALLSELALSPEGRARPQTLAGLSDLVHLHLPREGRLKRWLQRVAQGVAASQRVEVALDQLGAQTEERMRATQARLASLDAHAQRHSAQLEAQALQLAGQAEQQQQAREQLSHLAGELARCAQGLAALPLELASLQQNLHAQMEALFAAQAAPPQAPAAAPDAPALPSVLDSLRLSAADGATRFLEDLSQALAASDEAARLASRPAA